MPRFFFILQATPLDGVWANTYNHPARFSVKDRQWQRRSGVCHIKWQTDDLKNSPVDGTMY